MSRSDKKEIKCKGGNTQNNKILKEKEKIKKIKKKMI